MAPLTRRRKRALAAAAPVIDPADRLTKLPDEVLALILSFLPAQEAVQTCVLGRTWRNVWKITTRLHINADDYYVKDVRKFVDGLLRHRLEVIECAPLHACEITVDPYKNDDNEDMSSVNTWIRRALECKVQTLRVDIFARMDLDACLALEPLVASRHLARLELKGVESMCERLDLSGYPALEYLEITESFLTDLKKMTSRHLNACLVIMSCETNLYRTTIQVCVPRLVSLWLEVSDWTPLLESMAILVEAHVEFGDEVFDSESAQDATKCYLLEGLAEAKDLVIIANDSTEVFTSDLRWCPTFSNLKTLLLNDHLCEPADSTLACIIEHAPVLQKFTFIFSDQRSGKYKLEVKGRHDETFKSTMISQHLKKVKVKCRGLNAKCRRQRTSLAVGSLIGG